MVTLFGFACGRITIRVISALPEKLLTTIADNGVRMQSIQFVDEISFIADIQKQDYDVVSKLIDNDGGELKILRKDGVFWELLSFIKRPVLVFSLIVFLFLSFYLPTRVLFVQISGNHIVSNERILEVARSNGIQFGSPREELRSEKIKNRMLAEITELQWVGVNTKGCVAYITVKEKSNVSENILPEVCSISAAFDGTITEMTVTRGNPIVKVGDSVKQGDILVSGYTDCGLSVKAEAAEAEVFADTVRDLVAVSPVNSCISTGVKSVSIKISLLIGKKLINLFKDSGISGTGCVRMYERYVLTLPGGFELPLELICLTEICSNVQSTETNAPDAYEWVRDYARDHLYREMLAGIIYNEELSETVSDGCYMFEGKYYCTEMISHVCNEEFMQDYDKRD